MELLIVLPTSLLLLLALIEFGLILGRGNQVVQAAVVGASTAAVQSRSSASTLATIAASAVDEQLAAIGVSTSGSDRQVIVEEKTTSAVGTSSSLGMSFHTLADPLDIPVNSIRVTVCVRLTELAPDLLNSYSYTVQDGYLFCSAIRPYNGPLP